jgi:hypothetical protein
MEKGIIKLPISEVWEFINKPHSVIGNIGKQVELLPIGKYENLDFNTKVKKELMDRIKKIYSTGSLHFDN